ncbi:MAG: hypothetical protein AB7V22_02695 [Kiritimatiellia bacterium]
MLWMLGISVALLGYSYAGYPAPTWTLSRVRGRTVEKGAFAGGAAVSNEMDSDGDGYSNLEEQSRGYGPADPYDTPAMPGWPQQNSWADGSTLWRDVGPGEMP